MITVQIKPFPALANGKLRTATKLNIESRKDNLFDYVEFRYQLFDADGGHAGEAVYTLEGREAYTQWDASPEGAYRIVAAGIGLEIVEPKQVGASLFDGV